MKTKDFSLTRRALRSTTVWSLLALAASLLGRATAAVTPSRVDLWDISHGIVITDTSGIRDGFDAGDMFGGTASGMEPGNTVFLDEMPAGTVHYIQWQTPAPVNVKFFVLFAAGDGPTWYNEREFDRFVLKTRSSSSADFDLVLYDYTPTHPYTSLDAATGLLLIGDIDPVTAQDFRAEFTQFRSGRPDGNYDGPRIIELDAFSADVPVPPTSLWDLSQGIVITDTSGIRDGFDAGDMFGGTASGMEPGNTVFSDDVPSGFTHYIEWETPSPVTLGSFALYAGGDGPEYYNEREFDRFVLKVKSVGSQNFDLLLCDYNPPHPYPLDNALITPLLLNGVGPLTAQYFRAEFTHFTSGRPDGNYDGPRIVELQAFAPGVVVPLTTTADDGGRVIRQPDLSDYFLGSQVTLTAQPNPGFAFVEWNGDLSGGENPLILAMDGPKSVSASFRDLAPPEVVVETPVAGPTHPRRFNLTGTITDNVGVVGARWEWNERPMGELTLCENRFEVTKLHWERGENHIRVIATDAAGNEGVALVVVIWSPGYRGQTQR